MALSDPGDGVGDALFTGGRREHRLVLFRSQDRAKLTQAAGACHVVLAHEGSGCARATWYHGRYHGSA
jgi:hypothetical protein